MKYSIVLLIVILFGCKGKSGIMTSPRDTDITQACWWSANYLITHPESTTSYPSAWHVDYINYLVENKISIYQEGGHMPKRAFWDSVAVKYGLFGMYSDHTNEWIINYWQSVLKEGFVREVNMDTNDTILIKKDTFYFINKK